MAKHNFLDKLNLLLKANLRAMTFPKVSSSQKRIEAAEATEQSLLADLARLEAEIAEWDRVADEAVLANQDAQARYAIEKITRLKQQYHMTSSQWEQYHRSLDELLAQVQQIEDLPPVSPEIDHEAEIAASQVEDDLAHRRARLAKPD